MSTNFYHRTNICDCEGGCGRYDEKHIGKKSAGWQFHFRGYSQEKDGFAIESFEQWKREIQLGRIFDENGEKIDYHDFVKMVEKLQTGKFNEKFNKNPYYHLKQEKYDISENWNDNKGYSFSGYEFC